MMRSFQAMGGYFSAAKQKIKCKIQSFWQRDGAQAAYQGLTAPIYSRDSFKNLVSSSEDLQTSLSRAFTENATYAAQAFILYFLYYRMAHPTLNEYQEEAGSTSWTGLAAQSVIQTIDISLYIGMCIYLMTQGWQNSAQNILLTSAITTTAGNAMKPSPDFKPCDAKECGAVTVARAGLDSACFYLANRYIVNKISWDITHSVPGPYGKAAAFAIEAVSIGLPLVEYKFSAVGQCTMHKYKEMLGSYKMYCIMYGVSFVSATWGSYKALSWLSGEDNPYIYAAIFSLMFQLYVVLSIARDKKLPGNDHVNIDIMAWLTWVAEKPTTKFLLEKLLGDLYSIEKFAQSPGAGIAISVYDNEIKQGINSVKGGIQQARDFQNNRWVTTLRWVNTWFPYQFIPDGVTTACKSVSKTTLSRFIRKIEYVLDIGRQAELQRNAQIQQPMILAIADHFGVPDVKLEQDARQDDETKRLPMLQVTEPYLPRFKTAQLEEVRPTVVPLQIENKLEVPKEDKQIASPIADKPADQKFDTILQAKDIIVDSYYFVKDKDKDKEVKKTQPRLQLSQQNATLFAKKEGDIFNRSHQTMSRKQDSLASVTASIISNTVRSRALR